MADNYPVINIGDLARSISETHKFNKEDLIFLNTSDILHGKVLHQIYSPVKVLPGQAKKSIRKDDILFSEIRPANGRWAYVDFDAADFVVSTKLMVIRANEKELLPRYLYQFLTSTTTTQWLQHLAESRSGTFPQITFEQIAKLKIPLPPLPDQRAIAHILGTLDDKIDLNRRMNETLEAMARALFKDWFVDFGPVRAKMDGRWRPGESLPGLPTHLYGIFPKRFIDSELGVIPEEWQVSKIGEEVTVCGGATPSTKELAFWERGNHHWATPKDLSTLTFPVLLNTNRKITDAGVAKISSGLLPVGTVLLSSRAPIGYLAITEIPTAINQGFIAMKCNRTLTNMFILLWCRENIDNIIGNANGSTFLEISKSNFRPLPVIVPSKQVLSAFSQYIEPLYKKIVENERQSGILINLRDTLLPKLISGEIRIKDAKRIVGDAT